jgi:hypothetical protein
MTLRRLGGIALGALLATMPAWPYFSWGAAHSAHADHTPHHGGYLAMVGDHHLEVVQRRGELQVFVSDARRRPLRPSEGWLIIGPTRLKRPLRWHNHRLIGAMTERGQDVEVVVTLEDGTHLAMSFADLTPPG